jgi:O-antigen/teichoic acid export membrane protein
MSILAKAHGVRRPLQRIAAFSVLPAVSLVSNLIVLPILSARFGTTGWSSVLLGQSIGAAASVVCALSWPVEGAHLVARCSPRQRLDLYRSSMRQRGLALAAASPLVVTACVVTEPAMLIVCVLSAIALSLNALAPGWYFIGMSNPRQALIAEGGPRLIVNLVAVALVAFLPLWTYPVALMVGTLMSLIVTWVFVRRGVAGGSAAVTDSPLAVRPSGGRFPLLPLVARGADASYIYLSGPLVAFVAPTAYPLFAAVDRLSSSITNVMGTVTHGLVAWIAEARPERQRRRVLGAVAFSSSFAAICFVVLAVSTPLLLGYVFAGTIEVDPAVAYLAAAGMAGAFLTRSLAVVLLVPQGLAGTAYNIMLAVAPTGLLLVGWAAVAFGSTGAIAVVAFTPLVAVAIQLTLGLRRALGARSIPTG